jgi:hypothetical protein
VVGSEGCLGVALSNSNATAIIPINDVAPGDSVTVVAHDVTNPTSVGGGHRQRLDLLGPGNGLAALRSDSTRLIRA